MSLTNFRAVDSRFQTPGSSARQVNVVPAKVTVPSLQQKKFLRQPITCITAYDYASARLIDEAELDLVLVGDSLAMVMQGQPDTLAITMDEMLMYTRGVRRRSSGLSLLQICRLAATRWMIAKAWLMPCGFVKEAGAEAVKVEGGANRASLVRRLSGRRDSGDGAHRSDTAVGASHGRV